jgi:hypothetical protein
MKVKKEDTHKKISTRIWSLLLTSLETKIERACLRRDPYLERVLTIELDYLDQEIPIANSPAAHRFIAERLDALPHSRKMVTLTLRRELIEKLDDICRRKNIVRDAFFNRLFFLLVAGRNNLDMVFTQLDSEWRQEIWEDHRNEGSIYNYVFNPLEAEVNPFWALRTALEIYWEQSGHLLKKTTLQSGQSIALVEDMPGAFRPAASIYTTTMDDKIFRNKGEYIDLYGLNCYLADWEIPGTQEEESHKKYQKQCLESFLNELGMAGDKENKA